MSPIPVSSVPHLPAAPTGLCSASQCHSTVASGPGSLPALHWQAQLSSWCPQCSSLCPLQLLGGNPWEMHLEGSFFRSCTADKFADSLPVSQPCKPRALTPLSASPSRRAQQPNLRASPPSHIARSHQDHYPSSGQHCSISSLQRRLNRKSAQLFSRQTGGDDTGLRQPGSLAWAPRFRPAPGSACQILLSLSSP